VGSVIGEVLPFALGIALSPIPIMGVILMLQSPRARANGLGFLVGWVVGIVVGVVIFELLSAVVTPGSDDSPKPIIGVIQLVLGILLLVLAWRKWRTRPRDGEEPALPAWMAGIDTMTTGRAALLGLLLSAVNPKNLLLIIAAGVAIGSAGLELGEEVVATVIFVLLACVTVAGPVLAYLVAGQRMRPALSRLHDWLLANNTAVMAVLLLVIGVVVIGNGLGNF
jgi:threonine/homoserine/homoserine lactone efflux protein